MGVAIPQVVTEDRASGALVIDGSLKFDSGSSQHLKRTFSVGNRKTWTWSGWVKRSKIGGSSQIIYSGVQDGNNGTVFYFDPNNCLNFFNYVSAAYAGRRITTPVYRDSSSWYHVILVWDSTNATVSNRIRIYVNGSEVTQFSTNTDPGSADSIVNSANAHYVGADVGFNNFYSNQYLSNVTFIDGKALGPEYFGYTDLLTNTWRPKKYTGNFGGDLGTFAAPYSSTSRFSAYNTYGTLVENATGYTLPMSNPAHYGGKAKNLTTGGFKVNLTNSATEDFFFGCWVKFDVAPTASQIGIDLFGSYVYYEIRTNGVIRIRHTGGATSDSSTTSVSDGSWHHIALSRTGGTLYGFVDGTAVVSTTDGVEGNSVGANSEFWFFGGDGTSYNVDGQIIDPFIYIGQGVSSYTTPSAPLVDNSGTINHFSTFSDTEAYYISPGVEISGSDPNTVSDYYPNGFYLPFDGNSPIGEDKSGKGNNWTPVNFGGSNSLEKATGAKPILNTVSGGNIAAPGVFGSEVSKYYAVTVPGGTGGGFYLDGTQKPALNLIRGATYTFYQSDSSNSGHPLVFGTTADGNDYSDGVTTNGTPGSAGAYTKITVPHNAPDTLYYHCSNHSGMGNSTSQTTDETKADPYAWKNTLALPLVGSNIDVSNQINSGSTTKVMSSIGNAAASSNASNFYGGSYYFDGTGDGISSPDNTDFEFGSGDFTVECWVKQADTSGFDVYVGKYGGSSNGEFIVGKNGNTPTFYWQDAGGNNNINATNFTGNINDWYHMACVREGNVFTMYINGICENSTTDATTIKTTTNKLTIGIENDSSSSPFNGYLQDVRIYKGVAKYSGTTIGTQYFIPASTNPDILPDTPSGVSGGSKLTKIIDGAVSFDGGDNTNLSIADSTDFDHASAFTWEGYFYLKSYDSSGSAIVRHENDGLDWYINTSGNIVFNQNTSTNIVNTGNGVMTLNKWVHIAVSHTGSVCKMFVDGVEKASATTSAVPDNVSGILYIGETGDNNNYQWNGFISNLRFVNGTALYTSNFTPPSAPLTNVTNTKLLCCKSNSSAGAADVSPNISGINDGTVWSESLSNQNTLYNTSSVGNGADGFDGVTSTYVMDWDGVFNTNADYRVELILPTPISYSTSVRAYTIFGGGSPYSNDFFVDTGSGYGSAIDHVSNSWVTLASGSGTLHKIKSTGVQNGTGWSAIEIDGVILVNPVVAKGNAAATNFNPFNTDINTVRGQESGYATLNPLRYGGTVEAPKNGNLEVGSAATGYGGILCTQGMSSGKWYFEFVSTSGYGAIGIAKQDVDVTTYLGISSLAYIYLTNGNKANNNSYVSYGPTWTTGDVMGVSFDADNGILTYYKNGISLGSAYTGLTSGPYYPAFSDDFGSSRGDGLFNFGQKPFKFPPPDGFQPLNAANARPSTVITRPDQYVGVTTYTGDGNSSRSVNCGFSPDLVWLKDRNQSGDDWSHRLHNSVVGPDLSLSTNSTSGDRDSSAQAGGGLETFTSTGFTLEQGTSNNNNANKLNAAYVAWAWKAGGNSNTYNIDGRGYANASDVNMSVGSLNGSSYDTSQTWSNNLTVNTGTVSNATQAFNGDLTNGADSSASTGVNDRTMTATLGLTLNNEYVYVYPNHTYSGYYATIDGVDQAIQYFTTPNGFKRMGPFTGTLTSVTVTNGTETSSRPAGIRAIKVGNKILVDTAITPPNIPSIAPTGASVNTKSGFSIISYTGNKSAGQSIPHGLTQTPEFLIVKDRDDATYGWSTWFTGFDNNEYLRLNEPSVNLTSSTIWDSLTPTPTVFSVGDDNQTNRLGSKCIAYLWHSVPGFSKFGYYTSTTVADGAYVELGFTPAVILIKNTGTNANNALTGWAIYHNQSPTNYNPHKSPLFANTSGAEGARGDGSGSGFGLTNVDFLSNGFKLRETSAEVNTNAGADVYLYAAWAEAPTFNLYGAQSNAR